MGRAPRPGLPPPWTASTATTGDRDQSPGGPRVGLRQLQGCPVAAPEGRRDLVSRLHPRRPGNGPYQPSPVAVRPRRSWTAWTAAGLSGSSTRCSPTRAHGLRVGDLPDVRRLPLHAARATTSSTAATSRRRARRARSRTSRSSSASPPALAAQRPSMAGRQLDRAGRERIMHGPMGVDRHLHHVRRLRLLLRPRPAARGRGHPRADGDRQPVREGRFTDHGRRRGRHAGLRRGRVRRAAAVRRRRLRLRLLPQL